MPHPAPLIGSDRSHAIERRYRERADDDAQLRIRQVLALLEAAHGSVIHDLTVVIDGPCDRDVIEAAEEARTSIEEALASTRTALKWAVSACGEVEINERPKYAAVPHVRSK